MIVLSMLGGLWIAEFGGPDAMKECQLFAAVLVITTDAPVTCKTFVSG